MGTHWRRQNSGGGGECNSKQEDGFLKSCLINVHGKDGKRGRRRVKQTGVMFADAIGKPLVTWIRIESKNDYFANSSRMIREDMMATIRAVSEERGRERKALLESRLQAPAIKGDMLLKNYTGAIHQTVEAVEAVEAVETAAHQVLKSPPILRRRISVEPSGDEEDEDSKPPTNPGGSPPKYKSNLRSRTSSAPAIKTTAGDPTTDSKGKPLNFKPPCLRDDFYAVIRKQKVCLENIVFLEGGFFATVAVWNLDFDKKSIMCKYTLDDWESTLYAMSEFVQGSQTSWTETFKFEISVPEVPWNTEVEFRIAYGCGGETYWDNNSDKNYKVEIFRKKRKKKVIELTELEERYTKVL